MDRDDVRDLLAACVVLALAVAILWLIGLVE